MIAIRAAKVALVAAVALFASLVTFGEKRTSTGRQNPLTRSEMILEAISGAATPCPPGSIDASFCIGDFHLQLFRIVSRALNNQVAFAHGMF